MPPVPPQLPASAVQTVLSAARFQPYVEAAAGDHSLALDLYEWNIAVSAAFWEVIAVVEVAMQRDG